jgi:hypothetical protein
VWGRCTTVLINTLEHLQLSSGTQSGISKCGDMATISLWMCAKGCMQACRQVSSGQSERRGHTRGRYRAFSTSPPTRQTHRFVQQASLPDDPLLHSPWLQLPPPMVPAFSFTSSTNARSRAFGSVSSNPYLCVSRIMLVCLLASLSVLALRLISASSNSPAQRQTRSSWKIPYIFSNVKL